MIFDACLPILRASYHGSVIAINSVHRSVLKSCQNQSQSELSLFYPCLCNVCDVTVVDLFLTMSPPVPGLTRDSRDSQTQFERFLQRSEVCQNQAPPLAWPGEDGCYKTVCYPAFCLDTTLPGTSFPEMQLPSPLASSLKCHSISF